MMNQEKATSIDVNYVIIKKKIQNATPTKKINRANGYM